MTREEADRWWNGLMTSERHLACAHHREPSDDHAYFATQWWKALPDERAIAIYQQETQG